jgi:oligopeptide/dipeptide ABC transporter ATP-binding protein
MTVQPDAPTRPILQVDDLTKTFPARVGLRRVRISAVDKVSLTVRAGTTLGIVGESGCGKSTLARVIVGLQKADSGSVHFAGTPLPRRGRRSRTIVEHTQMVFQDPYSALNPRASIGESIAFPLRVEGVPNEEITERVAKVLEDVGLHPNYSTHYPHQLSGGQRQRVNIARALVLQPKLVVLDEAVSALDKSIQAQIVNLLLDLQAAYDLTYVFISHDLNVVEYMSDQVAVMYLGQIVELCDAAALYESPLHPYTQMLLASIPTLDPTHRTEPVGGDNGDVPSPLDPPSGCRFRTRCPFAMDVCAERPPTLITPRPGHSVSCHLFDPEYGSAAPSSTTPEAASTEGETT